jgi:N-acetylglucosaminyldiphosphoundecaprenol N-acetyl-beta-D-mannosaminyltransferase
VWGEDLTQLLGLKIDKVDMPQALSRIEGFLAGGQEECCQVVTLNAEIFYQAQHDPALQDVINRADLVTADGNGILWAGRQLGVDLPERVTGIDLMLALCRQAPSNGWRIFLLGGAPGVAREAAECLSKDFPGIEICGQEHGFFLKEEGGPDRVLDQLQKAGPDLLFVAMGAPLQEFWIKEHQAELKAKVAIGVGGSLDVISGKVRRAPDIWQHLRLEWLWRSLSDIRRLGRLVKLLKFTLLIKKAKKK